jgi:hypothetical protein
MVDVLIEGGGELMVVCSISSRSMLYLIKYSLIASVKV